MALSIMNLGDAFSQEAPKVTISNGLVEMGVFLPDIDQGYYRATRFDWAGVVFDLRFNGHSYFGKWFANYDPKVHESVMGPVDEFLPLGYEDTYMEETFVKIGVGELVRKESKEYSSYITYDILDAGEWKVTKQTNKIEFNHKLNHELYGYDYTKTLVLPKGEAKMVLRHSLTNHGSKTIKTQVYNHNFFYIDKQPIGSNYVMRFPYEVWGEGRGIGTLAVFQNYEMNFLKTLSIKEDVYMDDIKGRAESTSYQIEIENRKTKAGVRITGYNRLDKLSFWACHKAICPEPYITIEAKPGETVSWKIDYDFYTF